MTQRIDPTVLASVRVPRELSLSPDGNHVVYSCHPPYLVRDGKSVTSSLWMAEVGKANSSKQLTQGNFCEYSPAFSPDGNHISFISDRAGPGKGMALYLLPVHGGEAMPLTPTDNEMGVGAYKWSPDGKSIAFTSVDEKSEARKQRDARSAVVQDEDIDHPRLRIIDVATKEIKTLDAFEGTVGLIAWNDQGTQIAYVTFTGPDIESWIQDGSNVHVLDVEKNTSRKLHHFSTYIVDALVWQKDELFWVAHFAPNSDTTGKAVFSISATGTDDDLKHVAYGLTECAMELRSRENEVAAKVQEGLTDVIRTLDGRELYKEKHDLTGWDMHVKSGQFTVVVSYGVIGTPTEVYSVQNGNKIQLSSHGKEMADKKLGRSHLFEYTHDDGTPIDGLYGIPQSLEASFVNGKPSPTIVILHGGPFLRVSDSFDLFFSYVPFLMSLGYLVLLPNFRGGASHGHEYGDAVRGDSSQSYKDVVWLIKKGIEEGRIDKDRVGAVGWSFGGYLCNLAATRDNEFHFAAIVSGAGISDWATFAMTTDIPGWVVHMSGKLPWQSNDINDIQQRKCSPIYHMQNVQSPMLLIHGEGDWRVGKEQAVGFYRGLKARGKKATLVMYRGEGHGWPVPWDKENANDMLERLEKFFAEHVGKGVGRS